MATYAGDGNEAKRDGVRLFASFAQPSGLATDGKALFVADAESSCIRRIDFASGEVQTLAGGDLFDFGDNDGVGGSVRFQHPLGLAWKAGQLYIADAYNGKVKQLDPSSGRVQTIAWGFAEPGGLAFDGDRLLVADTAHQTIKSLDVSDTEHKTTLVALTDLSAPRLAAREASVDAKSQDALVSLPIGKATLVFESVLPQGYHLNREAPLKLTVKTTGAGASATKTTFSGNDFQNPTRVAFTTKASGRGTIELDALVSYCDVGAVCKVQRIQKSIPFVIAPNANDEAHVKVELP